MESCYYCGLVATTVDHVVPRHLLLRAGGIGLGRQVSAIRLRTVPACRECNCALGARVFETLEERRLWVKGWLRRKYGRLLAMPEWTESQLAEMGHAMREFIRASQKAKTLTRARIAYRGSVEFAEGDSR